MKDLKNVLFQNKKILVFPFDLLSHYLRCIELVEQHSENCDIYFVYSNKYNGFVSKHNFGSFSCKQFDSDFVMACARKFDFSWINETSLEEVYLSQVQNIQKYQPDIVIGDTTPTLKMACEKLGVTYYSLSNNYMSKYYLFTRKLSITHPAYKHLEKLPEKVANNITNFAEGIAFKNVHKPFRRLRKKHGLSKRKSYLEELEGDFNLFCDVPELFPLSKINTTDILINPPLYKMETHYDSLMLSEQSKPIICVTMGSTGDWDKLAFLNNKVFSKYTIITGGDSQKILSGPHIISEDFIPLHIVVPKCKLLICHAGNGTIYHGYLNHVFMLCFTSHFEQEWNLHALERNNIGKSINNLSVKEITKLIDEVVG